MVERSSSRCQRELAVVSGQYLAAQVCGSALVLVAWLFMGVYQREGEKWNKGKKERKTTTSLQWKLFILLPSCSSQKRDAIDQWKPCDDDGRPLAYGLWLCSREVCCLFRLAAFWAICLFLHVFDSVMVIPASCCYRSYEIFYMLILDFIQLKIHTKYRDSRVLSNSHSLHISLLPLEMTRDLL